jgi:molecular chaperone HtpG
MDIFIRELVSNGCDAISKFKRLVSIGEANAPDDTKYKVRIVFDSEEKTIKFIDNGIGMTAEEVKKYINQIAFSGAEDFINKYKDRMDEASQIIGHFGLGFYSAFMVSEKVQIDTLSCIEGAEGVKWTCSGGTGYKMEASDINERGTNVTLYLNEESSEFASEYKLRQIINKYCSFLPVEIYLEDARKDKKDGKDAGDEKPLNDTNPLWMKHPNQCTDEEYKEFYRKVFMDYNDPLFWIHLNVDYPFNLKGILYFPKMKNEFEYVEGQVKLYNNQVFVADNIKEVIPEFLLLLKGVVDCTDLPLNVSRSFLQTDKNVVKISKHIINKVADKLAGLFNNERERYNGFWGDINPVIKYGCLKDNSFYDKVKDIIIFKDIYGEYITLNDYIEKGKSDGDKKVFYVNDEEQQSQYIRLFKENSMNAIVLNSSIDSHFISFLEMHMDGVSFSRIDSDISDTLRDSEAKIDDSRATELQELFKAAIGDDKLTVKVEGLKSADTPAVILLSEHSRRMREMSRTLGGMDENMFPVEETLVINGNNRLIKALLDLSKDKKEDTEMVCRHIYDLAVLSHKQMSTDAMNGFIMRSNEILLKICS